MRPDRAKHTRDNFKLKINQITTETLASDERWAQDARESGHGSGPSGRRLESRSKVHSEPSCHLKNFEKDLVEKRPG